MMAELFSNFSTALLSAASSGGWEESVRFLGIKLVNVSDFVELILRFILNTSVIFCILEFIYARNSKRKDFYFSYMAVGVVVFLLCFLLNSVKLELGFALGLFAIFGIIRYRTDAIPIKEMTYLFVIIGVAVMNALANKKVSYAELLFTNAAIFFGLNYLEHRLKLKQEGFIHIIYDDISKINTENHEALLQDLQDRTGVEIKRFEIEKIDYLKDVADITIYFNAKSLGYSQTIKNQIHHRDDEN